MQKKGTIIVVDDNTAVLTAVQMLLKDYFERIVLLSSPISLPAALREDIPDIVLLDMNFAAGINTGNEGLFWLHEIKRIQPSLPVVLFTAYADIELAVRGIKEGAADFIVKPWDNRRMIVVYMLDALENDDNSLRFDEESGGPGNRVVNSQLNRVARILYDAKIETIQQEKYYELILNFINTGIIVLNNSGAVYRVNDEAMRLLGLNVFTHVKQLDNVDKTLTERLMAAQSGDKIQVAFSNEKETVNLYVHVSGIMIKNEHLRIMALNDINNELDEKEMDTWIRLIRILTHEIMNSVTPITSLSETLLTLTRDSDSEMYHGLQTINLTGKGLLSFVESYRRLTRIPPPEPTLFYVKAFTERMIELAGHQVKRDNIRFETSVLPDDLILHADENLITQVFINLLKNAVQAIGDLPGGLITIHAYCKDTDEVCIEVGNNGAPIPSEIADQIFIPFFTTKEHGSGVGLSISRQIMRLSGGSLSLKPARQDGGVVFVVRFR